jgi:hypothetical protein
MLWPSTFVSEVFNDWQSLEPSCKYTAHCSTGLPPAPRAHCMNGRALRSLICWTARGPGGKVFLRVALRVIDPPPLARASAPSPSELPMVDRRLPSRKNQLREF